ncbi:hypothetical protein A2U01_0111702, partial [Trifolium medium]|nr:hypothetical protein [Trifolium medium]
EVDCSRLSSIVRSGRNLSNKLRELLDEGLLDQVFVESADIDVKRKTVIGKTGETLCVESRRT